MARMTRRILRHQRLAAAMVHPLAAALFTNQQESLHDIRTIWRPHSKRRRFEHSAELSTSQFNRAHQDTATKRERQRLRKLTDDKFIQRIIERKERTRR